MDFAEAQEYVAATDLCPPGYVASVIDTSPYGLGMDPTGEPIAPHTLLLTVETVVDGATLRGAQVTCVGVDGQWFPGQIDALIKMASACTVRVGSEP